MNRPSSESSSGPNLTARQRRPLEARGVSVALSAGAGCGKTTVLTERFLAALEARGQDGLRTLVALTFTEKAARELRQRIRAECNRRLALAAGDDVDLWRRVLRGFEAATIGTFHQFCAGLLREHAIAGGIDPEFQVLDAAVSASLRDEAVARGFRRWLAEGDESLVALSVELGQTRVREAIADLAAHRDPTILARWVERDAEHLVAAWEDVWRTRARPRAAREFVDAIVACRRWLDAQAFDHAKLIAMRENLLPALACAERDPDDEAVLAALARTAMRPRGVRKEQWPSALSHAEGERSITGVARALERWKEQRVFDRDQTLRAARLGLEFARLGAEARRGYAELTSVRGGLDFDDLLIRTRDLLRDPTRGPAILEEVKATVEFVMVDEFQDTDPAQSEILRALTGDAFASGGLFVVGDYKQSIYRFRGARPQLFHEYREAFPAEGRLELTENFRSNEGILAFVNALFAGAFEGDHAPLEPGPSAAPAREGPCVAFVWAEEPASDAEAASDAARRSARDARAVEARWLADLIRGRLEAGWPIRERRAGERVARNAHAGDVAMLFRTMNDVAVHERALAEAGLDFYVVGGAAFFAQQEVADLVNVLSVVEDPLDSIALAGALRSPFLGVSDEGLFWLGGGARGVLAESFLAGNDPPGLSETDRQRLGRARRLLQRWTDCKDREPIAALLDRVLDESGYEASLLAEPLGDRKRANARKLARMARDFDARGGFTLADFVARLRADLRRPPREELATTSDEHARSVRLMTIHQAKGLEFPIVVLPDLNRRPNLAMRGVVELDEALGPVVRGIALSGQDDDAGEKSLGLRVLEAIEKQEESEESRRLFYVATTRARDALILSSSCGPDARPDSEAMRLLAARFDRRSGACLDPDHASLVSPIEVILAPPPSTEPEAPRERGVDLADLSLLIETTEVAHAPGSLALSASPRPRFLDLEQVRALPPRARRFDQLLRALAREPVAKRASERTERARRVARRLVPAVTGEVVEEVARALSHVFQGPIGGLLANAVKVERGASWAVPWAFGGSSTTVVAGWTDFLVYDAEGAWTVVTLQAPSSPPHWERLRWLLAARLASARNDGIVRPGWRVVVAEEVTLNAEEPLDEEQIDRALGEALETLCPIRS